MRTVTVFLAAGFLLASGAARADDVDDQAREQFKHGVSLYEEGEFEQAAITFKRAYELKPHYKILFNIGQAQAELKHYAAALKAYTRYLDEGSSAVPFDRQEDVKSEIQRLKGLVGMFEIKCPMDGAKVKVDRESKGKTPLPGPIFVDVGKHEVEVTYGGKILFDELLEVAGGQWVVVETDALDADPAAAPAPPPPEPAEDTPEEEPPEEEATEQPPDEEGGASPLKIAGWVTFGVGSAVLIGGAVTGGLAMAKQGELEDDCPDSVCPPEIDSAVQDERDTLALITDILIPVGGVVAAAGLVMVIVDAVKGKSGEKGASATLSPIVAPNSAGLVLEGRF